MLGGSLCGAKASAAVLLVHDDTLPAARRFAAHAATMGASSQPLRGERVRLVRQLLAQQPARVFGMTRHADHLLFAEIAREAGYVEVAAIQHRQGRGPLPRCIVAARPLSSLAQAAGACWPEAFAELALNIKATPSTIAEVPRPAPAFSWVLQRKG